MKAPTRIQSVLPPLSVCVLALGTLLWIEWPFLRDPDSLKFFGTVDAWVYTTAGQFFVDDRIHSGEFPFWNPLLFCGQPIAGNPQYLLFYPPNLLRSLLNVDPTPWKTAIGLAVLAFSHAVFAALGGYALARFRGLHAVASVFTGLMFALSSAYLQRFFLHHHIVFVVAWLPWNLLAIDWAGHAKSVRAGLGRYALAGTVFAMTLLAGSPQMAYFVAITMVVYWILRSLERVLAGHNPLVELPRGIAGGAVAVVVSIALAAVLLLPAYEFSRATQRLDVDAAKIETRPSEESTTLREALIFYPGGESHEGVKGIGAAGALLAILGVFSPRRREAAVFGLLAAFLLASSTVRSPIMHNIIGPLSPFPISSPGRVSLMAALPLAMLAGLGVDLLLRPVPSRAMRLVLTGVCLIGTIFILDTLYAYSVAHDWFEGVPIIRALVFPAVVASLGLACIWTRGRRWAASLAVGVALFDPVYWQSIKVESLMQYTELFPIISLEDAHGRPEMWDGNHRDSLRSPNSSLYSLRGQMNGYDPLQLSGYTRLVAREPLDPFWRGVIQVGRWSNRPYLLMKRTFWLERQWVEGEIPARPLLFQVPTTAYVSGSTVQHVPEVSPNSVKPLPHSDDVARMPLASSPVVLKSDGTLEGRTAVFTPGTDRPKQSASLHVRCIATQDAILEVHLPDKAAVGSPELIAMIDVTASPGPATLDVPLPDAQLGRIHLTAIFPHGAGSITFEAVELVFDRLDEDALIGGIRRTANSIELTVNDLPGHRILSFIDFAYPGWRAYVDGQPAPLLTTFSYFKGVEVPPGTHRVRFVFRPVLVYAGMAMSILALVVVLFVLAWALPRRPRDRDSAASM